MATAKPPTRPSVATESIRITGARQNNLRDLDLDIPLGKFTVVTGVSGSGKSSLAFDTLYSEGQRLYVETFSAYTRQFLDRMDKPAVDKVEGIPPAIAIDQTNPVRTSRSTVGTMTELNDHLKLLFARAATLYCRGCGKPVRRDRRRASPDDLETRLDRSPRPAHHLPGYGPRAPLATKRSKTSSALRATAASTNARQNLPHHRRTASAAAPRASGS